LLGRALKSQNKPASVNADSLHVEEGLSKDCRSLFENMLNGFAYCKMLFDCNGKPVDFIYLEVNPAFEKLMGLKKEAVLGKKVTTVLSGIEKSNPELFEICGRVALGGKGETFELFIEPLKIWLNISVYSSRKPFFIFMFENITERKEYESQIKCSTDRFMILADALPAVVFETDITGNLTYINQKALELTGFTKEELAAGKCVFDFFVPNDLARAKSSFTHTLETSNPFEEIYSFARKDGSEFPATIRGAPIKIGNKIVGLRGIIIDGSEKSLTVGKLAFQSQLLDSVGQAIIAIDKERIIRYWNNEAKTLYGWSEDEAIGRNIDELLTEFSAEEGSEIYERLAAGESWSSEIQVKRRDGIVVSVIVNRYPIITDESELIGSISIYTDVTEQKWMENELASYVDALAESSEKIKDLNDKLRIVGSLTRHDVRNKLSALNGLIYLLRDSKDNKEEFLEDLAEMEKVSNQLANILEFQRTFEQVGSEELTFVDVGKFFSEAVGLVSDFKSVTVDFKCEGLEVLADSLLRQLLYNLLDNTLKYGGKVTSIKLYYRKEKDELQLIYEDNGEGIGQKEREHLFERGFGKGTGIGLYMIRRIAEDYGWQLVENGEKGVCARFLMKIPGKNYRFVDFK
jgi:PAS domain S-box-containing protein